MSVELFEQEEAGKNHYGHAAYWDERYSRETTPFDWFHRFVEKIVFIFITL
jgi:hypothetical protein